MKLGLERGLWKYGWWVFKNKRNSIYVNSSL